MGERFKRPRSAECPRSLGGSALEIATREATLDIWSHEQTHRGDKDHDFTLRRLASVPERASEIEEMHRRCIHLMYERTLFLPNGFIIVSNSPDDPYTPIIGPCIATCTRRTHSTERIRSLASSPPPCDRATARRPPPRPRSFSLATEASFYPRPHFSPAPPPSLPVNPSFEALSYHASSAESSVSASVHPPSPSRTPVSATSDGEFTLLG